MYYTVDNLMWYFNHLYMQYLPVLKYIAWKRWIIGLLCDMYVNKLNCAGKSFSKARFSRMLPDGINESINEMYSSYVLLAWALHDSTVFFWDHRWLGQLLLHLSLKHEMSVMEFVFQITSDSGCNHWFLMDGCYCITVHLAM